jgi:two-component system, cell cycle sensor histidine kinase and response regulator CckA
MSATETMRTDQTSEMKRVRRILVVEDSPAQAHQIAGILASEQREVEIALDAERGLVLFLTTEFDLVITDVILPGMSGYDLCGQIKNHSTKGDVPVILVTSLSDPTNIIKGLECGANNFITKPYEADYLLTRVRTILDRKANRANGKDKGGAEIVFQGKSLTVKSDKEQILDLLIASFEDIVRTNHELQVSKAELASAKRQVDDYAKRLETRVRTTEEKRNQAEQALVESERRHRRLVEFSPDAMFINRANSIVFANKPCLKLFGATAPEQVLGKSVFDFIHPDYHAIAKEHVRLMESGKPVPLSEEKIIRFDGTVVDVEISASPFAEDGVPAIQVVCRDISDRKRLEEQFHQAQKMEAVGKLAGGIAHDFNNLLTVISGYSDVLISLLPADDNRKTYINEIQKAVERAVHLTRQLLAFSRKAVVEPRVLDLNALVNGTEKMLRRLIGEDISLAATLAPALGKIKADAGQIEQVIVNLAVNARDAMPQGGKLTIETRNVELGNDYVAMHPEVKPGRYVMLAVSDTGFGMSQDTKAHIFEPFFTTKGPGKGTGLGLSTVYGVVTQCGGHLEVFTDVGQGASFKIYFPCVDENMPSRKSNPGLRVAPHGRETILLVEDEEAVRKITKLTLQSFDYNVLAAENGKDAIQLCEQYTQPIDLLITDVVMPEMGGRQVAEHLAARRPGIKILFISGYTDDAVVRHGIFTAEVAFLQKPFTPTSLATKVREVLDQ